MFTFQRALPEEVGIPSSSIKELLLYLDKKDIPMHALLIMRKDKLVFEKYYAPYTSTTLHRMFSIAKSFTALAISLLADEGKIHLDDSITDYFPEYITGDIHPWLKETTIRNMLMMRTCHASTTYKVDMESDWVESFFTVPPTHKPGTVFHYDTSSAHVLCALVEKLTKMPMLDYLKKKALDYLDFSKDSYMIKDPFGVSIGGSGLMATPLDILKVLYLLDKKGTVVCNDGIERTIINKDFIEKATSKLSSTMMTGPIPSESCGYGMMFWQNENGGYVMYGMGGQLAISIPDSDLLVVTCADTQGIAGGNQVIYDCLYNLLLPTLDTCTNMSDKQCKRDYDELLKTADTLRIQMPKSSGFIPSKTDSANLCYNLSPNPQGFKNLELQLSEDGISFIKFDSIKICFGLKDMQEGDIEKYGTHYTAGAIWLKENDLYIKVHLIDECVGSLRFELFFGDGDITVFMRKIEETYFKEFDDHLYGTLNIKT